MKIVGRIPDALAKVAHELMAGWKVLQLIAKNDGKHRGAPEGTQVNASRIEITCIYFLYGAKAHESSV